MALEGSSERSPTPRTCDLVLLESEPGAEISDHRRGGHPLRGCTDRSPPAGLPWRAEQCVRHPYQRSCRSEPVFHSRLDDYRGSGQSSTAPNDTYTFARLADDLEELRLYLNLGSVPLLAHSMGGLVAVEFALRHASAKSLILAGVTPCMSPAATAAPMIRALGTRRTIRIAALRSLVPGRLELARSEYEEDGRDVCP